MHVTSSISEYKVIIVGLDNAGKTTILYQLWVGLKQDKVVIYLVKNKTQGLTLAQSHNENGWKEHDVMNS